MMFEAAFIILYLAATVVSQSLLDAALILLVIVFIKNYKTNSRRIFSRRHFIFLVMLLYFITAALGLVYNAPAEAPKAAALAKFVWVGHVYLFYLVFQYIQIDLVRAAKALSALLFLPTLYSLYAYYLGVDPFTGADNSRIVGLVNSATYHAHGNAVLFVGLGVVWTYTYRELNRYWKLFAAVSFILLGASIFLTFTRGIWISIGLSVLAFLIYYNWKRALLVLMLGVFSATLLYQGWPKFQARIDELRRPETISDRKDFIKVNLQMWQEHPLLGIGYGENVRRNREYWDRPEWSKPAGVNESHAHNQYLNVLSTTGVFGFLFFTLLVVYFLYLNISLILKNKAVKSRHDNQHILLILLAVVQIEYWLACLTDVTFEYAKLRALMVIVWGLLLALNAKIKSAGSDAV